MNCREFKNQFEEGADLSEAVYRHVSECEDCRILHAEELQLTQLIKSLAPVPVPSDFEFGVKSKIARGTFDQPLSLVWRILRYALPLGAAAVIFGLVIINSNLFNNKQDLPIADKASIEQNPQPSVPTEPANVESENELVADKKEKIPVAPPQEIDEDPVVGVRRPPSEIVEQKRPVNSKKDLTELGIRTLDNRPDKNTNKTIDLASTDAPRINPAGIEPDKKINTQPLPDEAKFFTAREILAQLGIETTDEEGLLRVDSVVRNSAGETSGVEVGDLVTAIDGQSLLEKRIQKRAVEGKTLRLRRNERELIINIRSN